MGGYIWFGCGIVGAVLAYSKKPPGRDGAERLKFAVLLPVLLVATVLLGPFGILMFIFTPALKVCPFCKVQIRRNATVCRACGRTVS